MPDERWNSGGFGMRAVATILLPNCLKSRSTHRVPRACSEEEGKLAGYAVVGVIMRLHRVVRRDRSRLSLHSTQFRHKRNVSSLQDHLYEHSTYESRYIWSAFSSCPQCQQQPSLDLPFAKRAAHSRPPSSPDRLSSFNISALRPNHSSRTIVLQNPQPQTPISNTHADQN